MQFIKTSFNGDPNIGLYGFATDSYCLLGFKPATLKKINDTLGVEAKICSIAGTQFIGIFIAGNKNGLLLPKIAEDYEIKKIKELLGINVEIIRSKQTALGNLILCNDKGCLIPRSLNQYKDKIRDVLGVDVEIGTVADFDIVGSAARASNKGCVVHREASEAEIKKIEDALNVKVDVGTVNFGTPFIKAGVIVNSKGLIVSELSTGPEIDRCFEVFK